MESSSKGHINDQEFGYERIDRWHDESIEQLSKHYTEILKIIGEEIHREGLEQTWGYMDKCKTDDGHLVIFDRSGKSWDKKIFRKTGNFKGTEIIVWGM